MPFEEFIKSEQFKIWGKIFIVAVLVIIIFAAGVLVGLEKARFSFNWGENYYRNFGGRGPVPLDHNFMNAHGLDGQILKIDNTTITIKGRDGLEKIIILNTDTSIKKDRSDLKQSDLKINDNIVVIGSPNSLGQINAKLVRVMPSLPPPPIK